MNDWLPSTPVINSHGPCKEITRFLRRIRYWMFEIALRKPKDCIRVSQDVLDGTVQFQTGSGLEL